jgi:hypothetical protein
MRHKVLKAVNIMTGVLWAVTLCNLTDSNKHFRRTHCHNLHVRWRNTFLPILKTINQITRHYIQKECGLNCISELVSQILHKNKSNQYTSTIPPRYREWKSNKKNGYYTEVVNFKVWLLQPSDGWLVLISLTWWWWEQPRKLFQEKQTLTYKYYIKKN